MVLENELGFKRGIKTLEHEALLNIYYTSSKIKKKASEFFHQFGLTDVQFNVLMLLEHQSGSDGGLSQSQLSDMMLVNRANVTSLIDRMEKAQLVIRTDAKGDRRSNIVKMTNKGKKIFDKVELLYIKQVKQLMSVLSIDEQRKIISALEKIRAGIGL
jgi:MarR family 2-MHQ and catechol resistance regulon transcriptional repressor